jgi:HEAT repeat protein
MAAPEDNLPSVQPPSARFLLQLFVVPLAIVSVIVLVCLMFSWLAHLGTEPRDLISGLSKLNAGSWQKALTVANMLTDRRHAHLRKDPALAQQLSQVLRQQMDDGDMSADHIKLRIYLCLALGVFEVNDGLSELMEAATLQRDAAEIEVRKTAIEAIARRADQSAQKRGDFQQNRELMSVLQRAASQNSGRQGERELDSQLRLRAAYALGVIGGSDARMTLAGMLSDAEPTVRYNAATGLARHGDVRAIPRLIEMLKVGGSRSPTSNANVDELMETSIIQNALRATVQLAAANPDADLDALKESIERLADADLSPTVRRGIEPDAKAALQQLEQMSDRTG